MRYLFACLLTLSLVSPALAAFDGPGSTQPNTAAMHKGQRGTPANTVATALKAADDSYATLEGSILEKMPRSDDKYVFEDASGKMTVEIDYDVFAGRAVTPQTKVRLSGEVDRKKSGQNQLDVDVMEIL